MGTLDRGVYLPDLGEIGWADEVNLNFTLLADMGPNAQAYATGDGVTDDTTGLQLAIAATPAYGTLFIPATSAEYVITDALTITSPINIASNGATIHQTGTGKTGIAVTTSDVQISGLRLTGRQRAAMVTSEAAISVIGATWAARLTNVTVEDCVISSWGIYGVHMLYVEDCAVRRNRISAIAYGGIMAISVKDVTIEHNHVEDIDPGNGNAYGIALTFAGADLGLNPRSSYCNVLYNLVEDVPTWEGIDTHGGSYHRFVGNTVRDCKVGLALQGEPTTDGPVTGFGIIDNTVTQPTVQFQAMTLTGTKHSVRGNRFTMTTTAAGGNNYNTITVWKSLSDCTFEGNWFYGTGGLDANNTCLAAALEDNSLNRNVLRDNVFENHDAIVAAVKGTSPSWYWGGGNRIVNQVGDSWFAIWYQQEATVVTYKGQLAFPSTYIDAEPAAPVANL